MDFEPNNSNIPENQTTQNPATPATPSPVVPPVKPVDSFGYPVPEKPANAAPQATQLNGTTMNAAPVTPAANPNPVNPYSQAPNTGYNPNMNNPVPPYNPNMYQNMNTNLEEPLSVGQWILTMLIMVIPCVNIVMMFVWAFGSGNKGRSNYFKASLIMAGVALVLYFILIAILLAAGVSLDALTNVYPY